MSKSLNNFYKLSDLKEKGYSPLDFRYLCLQSHYKSKLNFTFEALDSAKNARERLIRIIDEFKSLKIGKYQNSHSELVSESIQNNDEMPKQVRHDRQNGVKECLHRKKFRKVVADNLNTPEALAVIWEVVRDEKISKESKIKFIKWADENLLSLGLFDAKKEDIPAEILNLAKKRDQAKINKDFDSADKIRVKIEGKGYKVEDTKEGSIILMT